MAVYACSPTLFTHALEDGGKTSVKLDLHLKLSFNEKTNKNRKENKQIEVSSRRLIFSRRAAHLDPEVGGVALPLISFKVS